MAEQAEKKGNGKEGSKDILFLLFFSWLNGGCLRRIGLVTHQTSDWHIRAAATGSLNVCCSVFGIDFGIGGHYLWYSCCVGIFKGKGPRRGGRMPWGLSAKSSGSRNRFFWSRFGSSSSGSSMQTPAGL